MDKVKAGLRGLTPGQKVTKADVVLEHMDGNPHFPSPTPSLVELRDARNALAVANLAALDQGRLACFNKRQAVAHIDRVLTRMAGYVNSVALGNSTMLYSSGFHLVKTPAPFNELERPTPPDFRNTQTPNTIEVRWKQVKGALMYELEMAGPGLDDWHRVHTTSKTSTTQPRTTNGNLNFFRLRALGTQTQSPYSDIKCPVAA